MNARLHATTDGSDVPEQTQIRSKRLHNVCMTHSFNISSTNIIEDMSQDFCHPFRTQFHHVPRKGAETGADVTASEGKSWVRVLIEANSEA